MNSFNESLEIFKNKKSKIAYISCINSFAEYLEENFPLIIHDASWFMFANSFTNNHFGHALEKYIVDSRSSNKPIKTKARALTYKSVFNEYIKFLDKAGYDCSRLLYIIRSEDINGIEFMTQKVAYENGLMDKKDDTPPIPKDKIKEFVDICDAELASIKQEQILLDNPGKIKNKRYNEYLKCLIIKYMMAFGLKCDSISQIMYTRDLEDGKVKLGNNLVELPSALSRQTMVYLKIRAKILVQNGIDIENTPLFVLKNGRTNNSQEGRKNENLSSNQFYNYYLNALVKKIGLQSKGVSYITYRSIMNMIEVSVPKSVITSATGYDTSVYNSCLMYLQNEDGVIPDTFYYLNDCLKSISAYKLM